MKRLTLTVVWPLTIVSFAIFTKWWHTSVVDGPDEILRGFPLPYVCSGWHTSLSLQIFLEELLIDSVTYFSCWFLLFFCMNRFIVKIKIHNYLAILFLTIGGTILCFMLVTASNPDNLFYVKRPFPIHVTKTEYKFIWD